VDTDALIEAKAGQKISDIFARHGEKAFREMETAVLKELSKDTSLVIATGGGIVLKEENRDLLENSTFLVSLMASPEIIYERTRTDNNRPLLQDPNPLLKIETMLSDRKAFYEIGNLKINTDSDSLETICEIIFESYLKQ
ncbi:MAG: shikimate kinase, partial [Eubacteriaceae bacterium]|nr:shikimate kinase [Eubacteriaceae bacterium]